MHYTQELKMAESAHCVEEVISKDNKLNRNKFMKNVSIVKQVLLNAFAYT